ncbi:MAG: AAA family ATPase [Oscillospiraceae bacterium]|nr:AAA family ATPase [Oscillospiraceae bacterium]
MNTITSINADSLNRFVENDPERLIRLSEYNYDSYIQLAAEYISDTADCRPVVLLSGPSGSGKTTTAKRIGKSLSDMGREVVIISMDDYFLPKSADKLPVDDNGKIDLESPYRIDIPLFRSHLSAMRDCRDVNIPHFNFITQERDGFSTVRRRADTIILIEGIHALNPLVTGNSKEFTTCIYASVRMRVSFPDGRLMHPRLIRLMRRLCRDTSSRGRCIKDVFDMYTDVSRGEDNFIMPFKKYADIEVDTFIPYEICVYRHILYSRLAAEQNRLCTDSTYKELMTFLLQIDGLSPTFVPETSVLKEFI